MIRRGAHRVKGSGDGSVVFLYDDSQREELRAAELALYEAFEPEEALADAALGRLAKRGLLLAYERVQDDALDVELAVGPALSAREGKGAHWLPPQRAPLSLPSGVLCVETYASLRLGAQRPEVRGKRIELIPGHYLATIHRLDLVAMEQAELDREAWPAEFVALTPSAKPKRLPDAPAMLVLEQRPPSGALPGYEIDAVSFRGHVRFDSGNPVFLLNLDRPAATRLGLRAGTGLRISLAAPALEIEGVFLGEQIRETRATREAWAARRAKAAEFAEATWASGTDFAGELLLFQRSSARAKIAAADRERWIPATVKLLDLPTR